MARPVRSNAWFGRGRGWPHSALTGSTSTHPMPAARPVGDGCDLGYDAARRSLGTLRVRPRFPSRHRVIGYVVSTTWFPLRRLSSTNWSFTQPALARYGQRRRAIAGRRHDIPAPARYAVPIEAAPAFHVNKRRFFVALKDIEPTHSKKGRLWKKTADPENSWPTPVDTSSVIT